MTKKNIRMGTQILVIGGWKLYWFEFCPNYIESKYELLVFKDNNPFLPLTNY